MKPLASSLFNYPVYPTELSGESLLVLSVPHR